MAISKCDVIFKLFLILYLCVGLGSSLTLSSLTTRKPKEIKTVPTNNTDLPVVIENQVNTELQRTTTEKSTTVLYRLLSSNGATCILLKTDGLITITYKDKLGEDVEHSEYINDNPEITGECIEQDTSWMKLSWTGFSLDFRFYKTPGGERWYVDKVELKFKTDNNKFDLLGDKRDKEYRLTTNPHHSAMLFPTPVGKSFACDKETAIKLRQPENKTPKLSGVLLLRDLRLQPFMYKSEDFGTPFQCSDIMGFRDETAPIAVGSTLAIAVLGTITGYGIFRYFKIKKVQYDTME